ncbi:MAG: putative quinol monooxygenase [Desulfuromonadales bacterium]
MPKLTVVAKVVAKNESVEIVKSELLKLIEPTRKEDGCIEYKLHQDNETPAVFVFYETWESPACLEKHMNTDHFKSFVSVVGSLVEEIAIHKMTKIA